MEIFEILKYVLPSLVVFVTVYFLLKLYLNNTQKMRLLDLQYEKSKIIDPIRLQAYERMVLYLERISPSSLMIRLMRPGMSADELQQLMLNNIREEFEHNYSQQIYVSSAAWEEIRSVREQIMKNIHTARLRMGKEATGQELASQILELDISNEGSPIRICLEMVKNESRAFFS